MNERIQAIRCELQEIAKAEAVRLWRMARRMQAHGVSLETVSAVRNEASDLYNNNPAWLLDPFKVWRFAFIESAEKPSRYRVHFTDNYGGGAIEAKTPREYRRIMENLRNDPTAGGVWVETWSEGEGWQS